MKKVVYRRGLDTVQTSTQSAKLFTHVAKYWIDQFARIPVEIEIASEFQYHPSVHDKSEIAIFVSQSGETDKHDGMRR